MTSTTRAAVAFVLIAAAGPAGFFAYRALLAEHMIQRPQARVASADHRVGAPHAMSQRAPTAAASHIPDRLPDITLPDPAGTPRQLSEWRGRPLLVNFWATWCAPCRREIPMLEQLLQRQTSDHLQVVGIAVDQRAAALKFARALHIHYPILAGGEARGLKAIAAFGMADALPFSVFADARGRIITVKVGELHLDEARLILTRVDEVDQGRLSLAAARQQIASGLERLGVQRAKRAGGVRAPSGA